MQVDELRGLIGYVQQDIFLFAGDIASNIRLSSALTDGDVERAAHRVGADRVIARLPGRYRYALGQRGASVSVGERQLLSFARAIAADPALLVLDEATSAVDSEIEAAIQQALDRPAPGHRSFHGRPAQGAGHRGRCAALRGQARCRGPARRRRPARSAADGPYPVARRQLDRRRCARIRGRRRHRDVRARARSTRAPQPALLRAADGGYEIELVAGEEGVSPGQACVFYHAPSGTGTRARRRFHQERRRLACRCGPRTRGGCAKVARGSDARIDISGPGREWPGTSTARGSKKAYGRWAPIYDLVFGKVFDHGRQSTIAEADKIGGRVLDVGVGTGHSRRIIRAAPDCPASIFPSRCCAGRAQQRVRALGLTNVETLAVIDAKNSGVSGCVL